MKRIQKYLMALVLGLGFSTVAQAAVSDSLTVTITPNAFYAVDIDTANVTLDLGTVALGASTQTVRGSTVTIQSSYATTDLRLQGGITSAGTPWTFDANTASNESDAIATWATFTSIARSSVPALGADYFSGTQPNVSDSDVVSTSNNYVGTAGAVNNLFENNSDFDAKDMDDMNPSPAASSTSLLWLNFRLPNATTSTNAQNITIMLTAVAPQS
jgi:hypothetical protein